MDSLPNIPFLDYLDSDPRCTFVLVKDRAEDQNELKPIYHNHALLSNKSILQGIHGRPVDGDSVISWTFIYRNFRNFATGANPSAWKHGNYLFKGHIWTRFIVGENWIVISATKYDNEDVLSPDAYDESYRDLPKSKRVRSSEDVLVDKKRSAPDSIPGPVLADDPVLRELAAPVDEAAQPHTFSWPDALPEQLSGYRKVIRDFDWASTPLGPVHNWSTELRVIANLVVNDPEPALVYWGNEQVMIYSEFYPPLLHKKYPECLGTNALISLPDFKEYLGGLLENIRTTGKHIEVPYVPIFYPNEDGHVEEQYFYCKLYPIVNNTGVIGVYQRNEFITKEHLAKRR
jgi:hypothetical protein